jgi:AcrR family transcriptional regulator
MARTITERGDVVPALAEAFRSHGYEGASLGRIAEATRLGKGSLYHFFPGGKEEMAAAVLAEVDGWFREQVYRPLREQADGRAAVALMLERTAGYFQSGRRACLFGQFALGGERERFGAPVKRYFADWIGALAAALERAGKAPDAAAALAEKAVADIQGALVLARALDEPGAFVRALARIARDLD